MLRTTIALIGVAVTALPIPLSAADDTAATAKLTDRDGQSVGTVEFRDTASGVMLVTADLTGLPAGKHGFHIHQTAKCDADGGFKSAGGHLAGGNEHGVLTDGGPHPGDLPNVTVGDDGMLAAEFFVTRLSLEGGWFGDAGLFDQDGSAVVVHAGADDYTSQPSGDAGDRIACGTIER